MKKAMTTRKRGGKKAVFDKTVRAKCCGSISDAHKAMGDMDSIAMLAEMRGNRDEAAQLRNAMRLFLQYVAAFGG